MTPHGTLRGMPPSIINRVLATRVLENPKWQVAAVEFPAEDVRERIDANDGLINGSVVTSWRVEQGVPPGVETFQSFRMLFAVASWRKSPGKTPRGSSKVSRTNRVVQRQARCAVAWCGHARLQGAKVERFARRF